MGLVVTSTPTGGSLVPNVSMPIATQPYVLTCNTSSDLFTDVDSFDDSIYRILSMQSDMKTVSIQGKISNEFELFLQYGEDLTDGKEVGIGFLSFNNYLGSIGV